MKKILIIVLSILTLSSCCACLKTQVKLERFDRKINTTFMLQTEKLQYSAGDTITLAMSNNLTVPIKVFQNSRGLSLYILKTKTDGWKFDSNTEISTQAITLEPGKTQHITCTIPSSLAANHIKYRIHYSVMAKDEEFAKQTFSIFSNQCKLT